MLDHKTVSLADQVFDQLEYDILSGKYERGEIITELQLSTDLGVSRTPVREALRRLEQENLIEETGKGSRVIGISEKELADIFLVREKIECLAVAQAAINRTEEQLEKLREVVELQSFYLSKNDPDHIKVMDNRFHEMVYAASNSVTFYRVLVQLHKKIQKYRRLSVENSNRAEHSVMEHKAILEAIENKDSELASKLTLEHIRNAYKHIIARGKN